MSHHLCIYISVKLIIYYVYTSFMYVCEMCRFVFVTYNYICIKERFIRSLHVGFDSYIECFR